MGSNESNKHQDENRDRLLEEIRRRAEEAELKRIEEEDRSSEDSSGQHRGDEPPSPFPNLSSPFPSSSSYDAEKEQHAMVLRERLSIALDRRNLENARELLLELENFDPSDPELEELRLRLVRLAEEPVEVRPAVPPPVVPAPSVDVPSVSATPSSAGSPFDQVFPPAVPPPPAGAQHFDWEVQPPPLSPSEAVPPYDAGPPAPAMPPSPESDNPPLTAATQEEVASLFEAAVSLYEQEKYEQALHKLDQLLLKDRANEDALSLHAQIERAWNLAEVIKKEEERHRREEPPPAPVVQPVIPKGGKDSDFWGPTELPESNPDAIVVPEAAAPVRRPQIPLADRIVTRVSKVRIPVKPILIGVGIVAAVLIGYKVIDALLHAVVPPDRVICVFPPAVTEGGGDSQGIVDAFAEDLILDLGSVQAIHVVASQTAFASRQRSTRPERLAQTFGAGYYLLWTLAVREEHLSGSVTLKDTLHAQPVWQTALESSMLELPRVRSELARNILRAMDVNISGTDTPLAQITPGSSKSGYLSYLEGRSALRSGRPDAVDRALVAFQNAVREDSLDGDAWSALGWTHILAAERSYGSIREQMPTALTCVERAMSLGARKAEAFRTWGVVELINGDWAKALSRLEEAVNASPSDAEALRRLVVVQTMRGNADDALHTVLAALEVDPLNADLHVTAGLIQQFRGEFAEAEAQYRQAMAEDRNHSEAAELHAEILVYLQRSDDALASVTDIAARLRTDPVAFYKMGRVAQAGGRPRAEWMSTFERSRAILEEDLKARPDSAMALSLYALTQTRLGAFRDAVAAQQRALTLAPDDYRVLYNGARMYALQRDKQKAMANLTQAIDLRYDLRRILDMDLFNLRSDEEFLRSITR